MLTKHNEMTANNNNLAHQTVLYLCLFFFFRLPKTRTHREHIHPYNKINSQQPATYIAQ